MSLSRKEKTQVLTMRFELEIHNSTLPLDSPSVLGEKTVGGGSQASEGS